jgi:hypothetical protein
MINITNIMCIAYGKINSKRTSRFFFLAGGMFIKCRQFFSRLFRLNSVVAAHPLAIAHVMYSCTLNWLGLFI